jgi:hypothetical protein
VGFLNKEQRGDLIIELNSFPDRTDEESIADNFGRVRTAWKSVNAPAVVSADVP